MLYSEPVKGQWLIAHELYETAVQYKYHLTNINHIQGVQHPLANITQAYAQLILLDILIPIRFVNRKFKRYSSVVSTGHV